MTWNFIQQINVGKQMDPLKQTTLFFIHSQWKILLLYYLTPNIPRISVDTNLGPNHKFVCYMQVFCLHKVWWNLKSCFVHIHWHEIVDWPLHSFWIITCMKCLPLQIFVIHRRLSVVFFMQSELKDQTAGIQFKMFLGSYWK